MLSLNSRYCAAGKIKCGRVSHTQQDFCLATEHIVCTTDMELCPFPGLQQPLGVNLGEYETPEEVSKQSAKHEKNSFGAAIKQLNDVEKSLSNTKDVDKGLEIIDALQNDGYTDTSDSSGRKCFHCSKHGIVKIVTVSAKTGGKISFCGACLVEVLSATCEVAQPVKLMTFREATDAGLVDGDMQATETCTESLFVVGKHTGAPSESGDKTQSADEDTQALDVD